MSDQMICVGACMSGVYVSNRRLAWASAALIVITLLLLWQLPSILKAVPSRYVARLPEPMQALGERGDGVSILPTAAAPGNPALLLAESDMQMPASPTPFPEPPTPAPFVIDSKMVAITNMPTAMPTNTPLPSPSPIPLPAAARLDGFRHQFQTWNNCGPATTAMALSYFGLNLDQAETAVYLKPNPEDRNVSPYEISRYVNEQTPYGALERTNGTLAMIKRLVAGGFPVMIELGIEPPGEYRWLGWYGHYLLVVAYDDTQEQFWVYDSWFGTSDRPMENATVDGRILTYADADSQWRQFNRNYIVFYRSEQQAEVVDMIGDNMNDSLMWQHSLARARAELGQAPEDAFLWFNLGTSYVQLGQYEQAAAAFDQARAIGLPWRMLWYQFGPYEAYYQVGRFEDMLLLADVTLQDRPYFEESFYYRGLAQEALGEVVAATNSFQKAADFNPAFQPAVEALARLRD